MLFSGTIADNIRYGRPDATDAEIEAAARAVGAARDDRAPAAAATRRRCGERGVGLSDRPAAADRLRPRVLADPRILVLDEATASLDTRTEHVVQRGIASSRAGRTAIIIAHRLSTIRDADRIIVLRGGTIVERAPHDELMALGGLYHDLYALGFQDLPEADAASS